MPKKQTQIKILGVFAYFYPHRGGSQKYAEELYVRLIKDYSNILVDILAYNTDGAPAFERYRGMSIYRIPCFNLIYSRFSLPNPFSLIKFLYKLRNNRYTHVNTHIRFFDPTWWVWAYAKMIGAKSIFTGHVSSHPVYKNKYVQYAAYLVDKTVAQFSLNFYDYLTFTNKSAIDFFKKSLKIKKRPYLVYGGVDTQFFVPSKKEVRFIPVLNKKIAKGAIIITFVGRVTWTKGVTYLYNAIKDFYKQYRGKKEVYFIIGGPGDLKNDLIAKAKIDGLSKKVLFTGNLDYTQVRDLYSCSDIFINPSHHNEGFPNTILEAGSSGCFVIATDNAGTREIIKNGKTGLLVTQKDSKAYTRALLWSLENRVKRLLMAKNLRDKLLLNHDWGVIAKEFYKILAK